MQECIFFFLSKFSYPRSKAVFVIGSQLINSALGAIVNSPLYKGIDDRIPFNKEKSVTDLFD